MAEKKRRSRRTEMHEPGESVPCDDCRAEIALLRRAQELKEQEGLEGRELVEGVLTSLEHEQQLEAMWTRRAKKPGRS
jgi:hypothetical protein